jgi:hypothetical protein
LPLPVSNIAGSMTSRLACGFLCAIDGSQFVIDKQKRIWLVSKIGNPIIAAVSADHIL